MNTIGIIGAGQLGLMLGEAAPSIGARCIFLDPASDPPAASVGDVISLPFDSAEGIERLAEQVDVITYEFENVPVSALRSVPPSVPIYPPPMALELSQDRLAEKQLFESLGISIPNYHAVDCRQDLIDAADKIGLPLVLKTRRLGYDGKGQRVIKHKADFEPALLQLGSLGLIAEQWIEFTQEVSLIGVRGKDAQTLCYPLTENRHRDGILRESRAPADCWQLQASATRYLLDLMQHLDYVGVLALELFVVGDDLLANEIAPRVHNSGHWTIEGAATSQFENHLRAVLGRELGATEATQCAGMLNLIGTMPTDFAADPGLGTYVHDYGKSARPGRKLGHITVISAGKSALERRLQRLAEQLQIC